MGRVKLYAHSSGAIVESDQQVREVWYKASVPQSIVDWETQKGSRPTGYKREDLDGSPHRVSARWVVTSKGNFAFMSGWRMGYDRDGGSDRPYFDGELNYKHKAKLFSSIEILV